MISFFQNFLSKVLYTDKPIHLRFISILFLLFPITLITGNALPDIFLSLIGFYFLVISLLKKEYKYYKNIFVYVFSLFSAYIIFSGLVSFDPLSSLILHNGPIFYFRYMFFVLGVWYLLDQNHELIKYFTNIFVLVILFAIFDGLFQWVMGFNFFGYELKGKRITGIFNDEQILGHFFAHIVPLTFALLLYILKLERKQILFILIFLILSEVMIFITNDRAAFLKIVQFTFILIFVSKKFKLFRAISFFISILLISIVLIFSTNSKDRYLIGTIKEVSSNKIPYMPWTPVHEGHYNLAFNFFLDKPIFGNGPQFFKYTCIKNFELDGCASQPHNIYFQTLAELGLIGITFLFIGFIYFTYALIKQFIRVWFNKNDEIYLKDHEVALYALVFVFLWPLIPHGSFYNNWLNAMIFLPLPFILYFRNKN